MLTELRPCGSHGARLVDLSVFLPLPPMLIPTRCVPGIGGIPFSIQVSLKGDFLISWLL